MAAYPPNPNAYPPNPTKGYPGFPGEPPLHLPYYGCPPGKAIGRFFKKYATFSGRASRAEFWWVAVLHGILSGIGIIVLITASLAAADSTFTVENGGSTIRLEGAATSLVGASLVYVVLWSVWGLASIVPTIALGFRRCQDINWPGAMALIALPVGVFAIVFGAIPPNRLGTQYDADGGAEAARLAGYAPPTQASYGPPAQGGYGQPPVQGGYAPPAQPAAPPAQGGYAPPAQPYGQPPQDPTVQ